MRKALRYLLFLGALGAVAFWVLTRPAPLDPALTAGLVGDAGRGQTVFRAGGCASCHVAPGAKDEEFPVLSGGYRIDSPFGTFIAPNISPSAAGIMGWSTADLANALIAGVSPEGAHLYPSLPYTTYTRMTLQDVADLKAHLDTLPASDVPSQPHEIGFPFTVRRGLGLWKRLNLDPSWVLANAATPQIERGRYLVEALGHCGECHTPRNAIGGLDRAAWMKGAPNPSGKGTIPSIHPSDLTWSVEDIAYYLASGFTPDFDSAGGQMVKVIANMAHLGDDDRSAIAAYLKALP